MAKTQGDRSPEAPRPHAPHAAAPQGPGVPPLSHGVRRHLGQNLRGAYADSLSAPMSERLADLVALLESREG